MNKNIVIVHYNTPSITECLVRSINLFVEDAVIYIFDNSDKRPFTAVFDNVTVFDNTKGKYINFDEWLKSYPNSSRSNGKVNNWGSAKHCYSVEKCMELIKDNFILLDSDVLLKKDISDLYDENSIYIGNVIVQPKSEIKRILPFITYINTKMCQDNNVHYFNQNYMHGLMYTKNNKTADYYDTGAGFYLSASKFNHKEIKYFDYVIHYGHGSWNKIGDKKEYNPAEWLMINKRYWSKDKNKKVVYTCITGNYDSLIEPSTISSGFDYICFTDNLDLKSNVWDIRPLPNETENLSQVKKQRYVKINSHKLLNEYDLSIWVDGNVELKGDLNKFISETLTDDCSVYVPAHPFRSCIYDEAQAVISMKKDSKDVVNKQINRYKEEGFPHKYGLLQSNIMLRKHNDEDCIKLMEEWFEELRNGSHRDQLSFNYASWKNKYIKIIYLSKTIYRSEWFDWKKGHKKHNTTSKAVVPTTTPLQTAVPRKTIKESKSVFHSILERKKLSTYKVSIYS